MVSLAGLVRGIRQRCALQSESDRSLFAPAGVPGRPRRFHAYCVGMAKSGTHSIAGLFAKNYRTAHEPEDGLLVDALLAASRKAVDAAGLARLLRARDRRLRLEMDSSALNYFFLDLLLDEFR